MVTYIFPVCPGCGSRLKGGRPSFGPATVKCGRCEATFNTGLSPWANISGGRKVLLVIRELLAPTSMGGEPVVGFLFALMLWASVVGGALLILRLGLMIMESNRFSHTGEPPTWKFWLEQYPAGAE